MYQDLPFTAVSAHRRTGLILCKPFHAEFAGPGAAVGRPNDFDCHTAIAIGVRSALVELVTLEERQDAYRRRIQWMYWLRKLMDHRDPYQRAESLLASFDAFFEPETVATLPFEVLAALSGVFPQTMERVKARHYLALGIRTSLWGEGRGESRIGEPPAWRYVSLPTSGPSTGLTYPITPLPIRRPTSIAAC